MTKPKKRDYSDVDYLVGISHFEDLLKGYMESADNAIEALEAGAEAFVDDLKKLPRPFRAIRKGGYTHLIDTFQYRLHKSIKEVTVGWGKYYGVMLEFGAVNYTKAGKQPHMRPLYDKNQKKYQDIMIKAIGL